MTSDVQFGRNVLESKERAELQTIAEQLSVKTTTRMKKGEIIEGILSAAGVGESSPESPPARRGRPPKAAAKFEDTPAEEPAKDAGRSESSTETTERPDRPERNDRQGGQRQDRQRNNNQGNSQGHNQNNNRQFNNNDGDPGNRRNGRRRRGRDGRPGGGGDRDLMGSAD